MARGVRGAWLRRRTSSSSPAAAGRRRARHGLRPDPLRRARRRSISGRVTRVVLLRRHDPHVRRRRRADGRSARVARADARDARRVTARVRAGVDCRRSSTSSCELYEERGYPTSARRSQACRSRDGFFHGLGHGVGLEVHEPPYMGRVPGGPLVAGDVITIEPGLYRQGEGGVRLEDLALVTDEGCEIAHRLPVRPRGRVSSDAIESLLLEERRYPPPPEFAAQANAGPEIYERDFDEFWETQRPRARDVVRAVRRAVRVGAAVREVVPRRQAQRLLQLRRPPRRGGLGDRVAYLWEGEPADERLSITYAELQRGSCVRERAEGARRRQGHGRRDLHGDGARAPGRDARVYAARCAAHGRLRRASRPTRSPTG